MKKSRLPFLSVLWLALALFPVLRAQETPPAPAAPAARPADPEAKPAPLAAPADDKAVAAEDDEDQDQPAEMEPAIDEVQAAKDKLAAAKDEVRAAEKKIHEAVKAKTERATRKLRVLGTGIEIDTTKSRNRVRHARTHVDLGISGGGNEIVVFNRNAFLGKGETAQTVVAIGGNAKVDGDSHDAVVTVLGSSEVNGKIGDAVVAVLGSTTVNGHVADAVVAVLGNVTLGPDAVVEGEVVSVGGSITRDPKAIVKGSIREVAIMDRFPDLTPLKAWISKCLFWGRMLWFGPGLTWVWLIASAFLVFYTILALLFPRGIEKTAEVLEQRPGGTFLAMLLTVLLTPVLVVLLCITVVGVFVVPFLIIGMIFATLFGKASVFAWIGRRIIKPGTEGALGHPAFAVFIGGLIVMLLYTIPILGILLFKFFGLLGLAMVVYRLMLSMQREKPKKVAVAAPTASAGFAPPLMSAVAAAPTFNADGSPAPAAEVPAAAAPLAPPPVLISAVTLPRAGFWIRLAAELLDFLMVAILVNVVFRSHDGPGLMFFFLAAYSVVMWKTKGTTIGGVICGLKVVRLDDQPLDWTVAVVRALTAFLSFCVGGLGFIWVAFDDEKQSWHDKVAGTTIVRVPKGTPLL